MQTTDVHGHVLWEILTCTAFWRHGRCQRLSCDLIVDWSGGQYPESMVAYFIAPMDFIDLPPHTTEHQYITTSGSKG
ncbi:MAG: hypothetical protein IPL46_05445 [Saprospiraceae bacterium]|nr:hypothetical protein [Saprospiraceae bacterium]